MKTFFCEDCKLELQQSSRIRHLKSKKHILNSGEKNMIKKDCCICYEKKTESLFKLCKTCQQKWCIDCDLKLADCPFCRNPISGREEQLVIQKRENREWQLDQDAFRIQNVNNADILAEIRMLTNVLSSYNALRVINRYYIRDEN